MDDHSATAVASPNIALIKYWGNRDAKLRLPANDSLSITLGGLETKTTVQFRPGLQRDSVFINQEPAAEQSTARVAALLSKIRPDSLHAEVHSENNFPAGAGLASSASGFAALALAASRAAGVELEPRELSILARLGSGSAARSIFAGLVRLRAGDDSDACYAEQVFPKGYWPLVDLVTIVSAEHKSVGSTRGHALADTSPLQSARVYDTPARLERVLQAYEKRDFDALAETCELDSNLMHAVMQTSNPPLLYWTPATVAIMQLIRKWRSAGEPVFYTVDAGPNVHCLTTAEASIRIRTLLEDLPDTVSVLSAGEGDGARLVN